MNTLLVGYDLNKKGQDYDDLIDFIKSTGTWCHPLDSTWLVRTEQATSAFRDELMKHIDSNDEILVVNVTSDVAAWYGLSENVSKWLKENL